MPRNLARSKFLIGLRCLCRRRLARRIVRKIRRQANRVQDAIDKMVYRQLKELELRRYLFRGEKIESRFLTFLMRIPTKMYLMVPFRI